MFEIQSQSIDRMQCEAHFTDKRAGGVVVFEGRVRDLNDGKVVTALEYEAYHELCITEARLIFDEARRMFDIREAFGWHREGLLKLGDVAVWIGVSAQHRGDAFKACRYIIDEIKHRLPIWKKEHYENGPTEWINCQGCTAVLPFSENDFYHRQMGLTEMGVIGQERLRRAKVLVIGAGGIGVPVLTSLVASGVGEITIIDHDVVEASNLHRQTLYRIDQIGAAKALCARESLRKLNPFIVVNSLVARLDESNVIELTQVHDIVIDCSDNFETKFLAQDACHLTGKALFQSSIHRFDASQHVYIPGRDMPCLRCVWPVTPEANCVASCADAGVLGAAVGIIGNFQALEAIRYIMDREIYEWQGMRMFDLWGRSDQVMSISRRLDCPLCSDGATITAIASTKKLSNHDLELGRDALWSGDYMVVDIREPGEYRSDDGLPSNASRLPISTTDFVMEFSGMGPVVLVCHRGLRSLSLAMQLRRNGLFNVFSLKGGVTGLKGGGRSAVVMRSKGHDVCHH
jgi:adenylyltransferase/sulfurtransferase